MHNNPNLYLVNINAFYFQIPFIHSEMSQAWAIPLLKICANQHIKLPTQILSLSMHMQNIVKFHQFVLSQNIETKLN